MSMTLYKIDVYLDENYIKTVYRDGDNQVDVETETMETLEITLDVEEVDA